MNEAAKYKVLFIDDEPASLTAFKSVFRDYYQVFTALSAEDGYEIMKSTDINIVISDQRMPGITGVDFLQRIRLEFPETVRMLITGYSDIDAVIRSVNDSMISYYFAKPYDENEMKVILDNAIERIRLIKQNTLLVGKLQDMVNELSEARVKAEESSRLKSSLLANLNHEFRTPMNSILGFSQLLQETVYFAQCSEFAKVINCAGQRLMKTLNGIIDLASFEADLKFPDPEMVNLGEILMETVEEFREQAKRKKLILKSEIRQAAWIHFPKSFASMIVGNLLDNAIKFTDNGEIGFTLDIEITEEGPRAILMIRDSGIGIDPADHEKIFEDFRQLSEGHNRFSEGLGIGLSLCKRILTPLQGEIKVTSAPGQGSTFTVSIPAIIPEETQTTDKPLHESSVAASEAEQPDATKKLPSILVVEDNIDNMNLIDLMLRKEYILVKAFDSESAIEYAGKQKFAAILMDINLGPGLDGTETMKRIKKISHVDEIPVIAVTGYNQAGDREQFLAEGFTGFLSKPFTRQEITEILQKVLTTAPG